MRVKEKRLEIRDRKSLHLPVSQQSASIPVRQDTDSTPGTLWTVNYPENKIKIIKRQEQTIQNAKAKENKERKWSSKENKIFCDQKISTKTNSSKMQQENCPLCYITTAWFVE